MSLADLIKKGSLRGFATATPATPATDRPLIPPSVATVATVAVANAQNPAANDPALPDPATPEVRLIEAAMRACDHHNDNAAAREQMRLDCLATPQHLRADLLDHFQQTYPKAKP